MTNPFKIGGRVLGSPGGPACSPRFPGSAGLAIIAIALLIPLWGCVSIPPAAPDLSAELGLRIDAVQVSHLTLLQRFFELQRTAVDSYIQDEWVPVFAEEVFSDPGTKAIMKEVLDQGGPEDQLKLMILMGTKLQERINLKRTELITPLDNVERRIEQEIRNEYAQQKAINNAVTSFLLSASKVAENRDRLLTKAGITEEKVGKAVDRVDRAVSALLSAAEKTEEKVDKIDKYLEALRSIADLLRGEKEN